MMSVWKMFPMQGQTGPKGETGTPGPPGPPVRTFYNFNHFFSVVLYQCFLTRSSHVLIIGSSWRCYPSSAYSGLNERQNTKKHWCQSVSRWCSSRCQLQGLRRRHGGNLWLVKFSKTRDWADEASTGNTGQPCSDLQGPPALPPWLPRRCVTHQTTHAF